MHPKYRLLLLLTLWPISAFAYIDPGSGMLLVQGLIALVGGIIVFIKNPVKSIKQVFQRIFKSNPP